MQRSLCRTAAVAALCPLLLRAALAAEAPTEPSAVSAPSAEQTLLLAQWIPPPGSIPRAAWPGDPSAAAAMPAESARPLGPLVTIVSSTPMQNGAISDEVEVASPSGEKFQLQPLLDGEPVRSFSVAQSRNLALAHRYTLTIQTPKKDGVLALVARTGLGESEPAVLRIRRGSPEKRPALYVLSVGVGRYQSADVAPLRYPAKDALDLAFTLKRQRDLLYREVVTRVLTDGQASTEGVREGFAWLAQAATREDTAVVFLAGHGTNDPDGEYYYLPADAKADRQTLISGAMLQEWLRPIAGRVVLLLDTCHSGNVLGKRSLNRLVNELATENRIVVFAASTGDQTARESAAWQNGAFTKALIEGLRGVADYAEDSKISMSELETWTSERVSQLTAGAQTPTMAKPNAIPDYVLAALPERGVLLSPKRLLRRRLLWGSLGAVIGVSVVIGAGVAIGIRNQTPTNTLDLSFQPAMTPMTGMTTTTGTTQP